MTVCDTSSLAPHQPSVLAIPPDVADLCGTASGTWTSYKFCPAVCWLLLKGSHADLAELFAEAAEKCSYSPSHSSAVDSKLS